MNNALYQRLLAASVFFVSFIAPLAMALDGEKLYVERGCVSCHGKPAGAPTLPMYPRLAGLSAAYLHQQASDILSGQRSGGLTLSMRVSAQVSGEELRAITDYLGAFDAEGQDIQQSTEQGQQFAQWSNQVISGGFNAVASNELSPALSHKGDYRKGPINKNQLPGDAPFYSASSQPSAETIAAGKTAYAQKTCGSCHGEAGLQPSSPSFPVLAGQPTRYTRAQLRFTRDGIRNNGQALVMKGFAAALSDEQMDAVGDYLQSSSRN